MGLHKKILILIALLITAGASHAQKISPSMSQRVVFDFMQATGQQNNYHTAIPVFSLDGDTLAVIYNFESAFIVVGNYFDFSPVKAFSLEHSFKRNLSNKKEAIDLMDLLTEDYLFQYKNMKVLKMINEKARFAWENNMFFSSLKNSQQYGPLLSSEYGQVNCKDENGSIINVTNIYTPNNYAVGCVGLCLATCLRYFEWPRKGMDSHSYTDNYGSSNGTYSANFESQYYNWALIKDLYYNFTSSIPEREELGKLAYHAAVSVNTDFEYNGATSNINKIPTALVKHFRYTAEYSEISSGLFWANLDTNMVMGYPVQFSIYTTNGAGHAIVCDGLLDDGSAKFYHLNMGWWGESNSWYKLQDNWNAGGYSILSGMVYNMWPVPEMATINVDHSLNIIDIEWYYSGQIIPDAYELQVRTTTGEWETIADNLTSKTYEYMYDEDNSYSFRVRAQNMGEWKNNGWSNIETISISEQNEEDEVDELFLYPIIAVDQVLVKYKNLAGAEIKIYDLMGHLVNKYIIPDNEIPVLKYYIPVSHIKRGYYIVEVNTKLRKMTSHIIKGI